jgi:nitrile hydratase accessory protein
VSGLAPALAALAGAAAPPARGGDLVFAAPWQGRALAMALGVVDRLGLDWDAFRTRLVAEIDAHPHREYYESWLAALERLVLDTGLATPAELAGR